MAKKKALGKGLGALIENNETKSNIVGNIVEIKITDIETNPFQPRTVFDDETLQELSISIKELGIVQPITVRQLDKKNKFQLISGERRYRAAKLANLSKIPAYVRTADDQGMLEMALVENIQREDLDSIEVAISYKRLLDECKLTQETLSDRIGKKRSTVANYLRLLKLPAQIQLAIRNKEISMGHAKTLINIEDADTQVMVYEQIIKYSFSVRKTEEIVRELNGLAVDKKSAKKPKPTPSEYIDLKNHLAKFFGTGVEFNRSQKGKGKIVIKFNSDEELERIAAVLDKLN